MGLLVLWGSVPAAFGEAVRGIHALANRPIAPRGGVLMLPLGSQRPGDNWPATIPLIFDDGSTIDGTLVWIHSRQDDPAQPRRWTSNAAGLAARSITQGDDSSTSTGAPYLLARLPMDGDGPVKLGRPATGRLQPIWHDLDRPAGEEPTGEPDRPRLELIDSPDRPDATSPFEYWRWVLLAERLDHRPPPPEACGGAGGLLAEHYANVWRIGLDRLAACSPGVAAACRDWLTRICADRAPGGGDFAAWVARGDDLDRLLAVLLDPARPGANIVDEALAWVDSRSPLLVWQEVALDDHVQLAIVNRSFDVLIGKLAWEGAGEIPIAVELEPGLLTSVRVDRPASPEGDRIGLGGDEQPARPDLLLEVGGRVVRLAFPPRQTAARPPGAFFPPMLPALTLAEIESGRQLRVDPSRATSMHIRRLWGRWEVFFECRRPRNETQAAGTDDPLRSFAGPLEVRGVEAVTVLIGPEEDPIAVLTVPENGWHRLFAGGNDGTLQVHRRSFADRWHCRIVLPEAWLPVLKEFSPIRIGGIRSHGDGRAIETTPGTSAPWRQAPGRAAIILGAWDDALPHLPE